MLTLYGILDSKNERRKVMNTTRRWLTHLSAFFFVLFMAFGLTSYADDGMKVHF